MANLKGKPSSIESLVDALKPDISLKNQKRLRLNMVLRVARRLDSSSLGCESCVGHLPAIDRLINGIKDVDQWQLPEWKAYYRQLDGIIRHLKTAHHLTEEGEHLALWIAIGLLMGTAIGSAFDVSILGVILGVAFGVAVGGLLDAIAHKQGRVI
ncbi:hypothetical protein [Dehalogenimonas etheniformans]|uniref:Glycine zipper-like domain-containing protein n=1 Tax=Dehalogenimonas etheniformans TaxID=1536648 RepID=A0A2P5PA17_9CHLR|nr:hypothetical protein [Dehalogenimonas etheniformans]PPD59124.1 hypothetical protein JP09_000120 [Dehalogenimonas etheniformans]QNT75189.1 hypothetical protein HX448_03595 [Dehalogenimonas etheniformans]